LAAASTSSSISSVVRMHQMLVHQMRTCKGPSALCSENVVVDVERYDHWINSERMFVADVLRPRDGIDFLKLNDARARAGVHK